MLKLKMKRKDLYGYSTFVSSEMSSASLSIHGFAFCACDETLVTHASCQVFHFKSLSQKRMSLII